MNNLICSNCCSNCLITLQTITFSHELLMKKVLITGSLNRECLSVVNSITEKCMVIEKYER